MPVDRTNDCAAAPVRGLRRSHVPVRSAPTVRGCPNDTSLARNAPSKIHPRPIQEAGMKMLRKVPGAVVGGAVAVLLVAGPAAAHECFVASRSAQGNASVAAHSAAWGEVSLDTILTQFIGVPQNVATCVETNAGQY